MVKERLCVLLIICKTQYIYYVNTLANCLFFSPKNLIMILANILVKVANDFCFLCCTLSSSISHKFKTYLKYVLLNLLSLVRYLSARCLISVQAISQKLIFSNLNIGTKDIMLNKFILYLLFYTTLLVLPGKMAAQCATCTNNVVVNGGFDSNTSSWISSNGNFSAASPYPMCGTAKHAMIQRTSGTAQFYQDVTNLTVGQSYQLTFWGGVHVPSFDAQFGVEFHNSNSPSSSTLISQSKLQVDKTLTGTPRMQFYTLSFTIPTGTLKVRVIGTATGDWIKVDEVCIQAPTSNTSCTPPSPNSICTPPTSWNVDVVATGSVDWQTLTGVSSENVTGKIRISGTGTVIVRNKNLTLNSANAVVFIEGATLIVDNGCLTLPVAGGRYIQNCGGLRVTGGFHQTPNTGVCISNTSVDIGQEKAGPKFTTGSTFTSAHFQNDGGYRYLDNNCMNITSHFILKATGSGSGTNGVDIIKDCFIEVGDAGIVHARDSQIGASDPEDAGNWDSGNNQNIYNTTIIIANGNFVKTNKTSVWCDVRVKVNKNGNFHVNSGFVVGSGLRVILQNDFGNCGNWSLTNILWFSAIQSKTNVVGAGTESTLQILLNSGFATGCQVTGCGGGSPPVVDCAENEKFTFESGAFIINMGITPQTDNNALKPYGMVYDLIKNYNVKIFWVINPDKQKDGIDFKYNNIEYKGGPFIIPVEYRTSVINARINYWQTLGVVGTSTISKLNICQTFLTRELKNVPRWTLDKTNGKIAVEYFINAGIPENAYGGNNGAGWKNPSELNCCDDLFVLPHAEPSWNVHQRLFTWNLECKGGIWDGCTSGSAIENMVNPANRNQQTNFLTVKDPAFKGTSGIYANSNTLMLWTTHNDGTPPYIHRLPADPVAQYIGSTDGAHTNGAEQIYIPRQTSGTTARWNPTTKIIAYDPSHSNVLNVNQDLRNAAASIVYGRGFEDPNRGFVMHSAGHSYDKGSTTPAHIAAQRAFFNFSWLVASDKAESINFESGAQNVNSGVPTRIDFSIPGNNLSGLTFVWSSNCGGTFSPNAYDPNAEFIPPNTNGIIPCVVTVAITDPCGRVTTDSKRIEIGCDYIVEPMITSPSCTGNNNGYISMEIRGASVYGSNDWSWTRTETSGSGSGSGNMIAGLSSGTYKVTVTSFTGCSASFTAILQEPRTVNVAATPTNYTCFGSTGSVILTVTGGTLPYSYLWNSGSTASKREGITSGTYTVSVTDASGCTGSAMATVTGPSNPINLTLGKTNISCSGSENGTVTISQTGGNVPFSYIWADAVTTMNRSGLSAGAYSLTVTDASGCMASANTTIIQPQPMTVSISPVHPVCPAGAGSALDNNGSINVTVAGGTLPYLFTWNDGITTKDRNNLSEGTYIVTITDGAACQVVRNVILKATSKLPDTPASILK